MRKFNIDDIKTPENLDEKIKNSIELGFKRKEIIKKKQNKKIAVAAIITVLIGTYSIGSTDAFAKFKSSIESFLNIKNSEFKNYSNSFNNYVNSSNVTINIDEFILGDNTLKINSNFDFSKNKDYQKIKKQIINFSPVFKLFLNDVEVIPQGNLSSFKENTTDNFNYLDSFLIFDDYFENFSDDLGYTDIYKNNKILKDIFNNANDSKVKIRIEISDITFNYLSKENYKKFEADSEYHYYDDILNTKISGNWTFEDSFSLKELASKTKSFHLNKKIIFEEEIFQGENPSVTITELKVSPLSITLKYKGEENSPFLYFKIYDENNNLLPTISLNGLGLYFSFEVNNNISGDIIKIVPKYYPESYPNSEGSIILEDKAITINIKTGEILE